jgi:hypothetical protein
MTKREAINIKTDMTVRVVLVNTKTQLRVCPKLKETIIKQHNDWSIVK